MSKEQFYTFYDTECAPKMKWRPKTFRMVFEYLDNLSNNNILIVETGTTRGDNKIEWEGMSTVLFDTYLNTVKDGKILSIDISEENCNIAKQLTSQKTTVICDDSVNFLGNDIENFCKIEDIDLLYLDSFDMDWDNPHPSSFHHMKEIACVFAKLKKDCLIVIDDNNNGQGKGAYVSQFLRNLGCSCLFDEWQIGFIK
jgi:hypothetical protein